jgi:hypothetical protein
MNINRNNYEEFFLMYVDGELNNHQQQMVEAFVQQNTDLQFELDMLLQTKLVLDEEIVFDKSALYKNETDAINATNAEEKFLLYVDNELNTATKAEVETFVLQHPAFQNNFTALKNTVLPVETIVCPDKESLYKKEEKPVVFMWFKRLSVAAAILFFSVMAWQLIPSNTVQTAASSTVASNTENPKKNEVVPVNSGTSQPLKIENTSTATNQQKMPVVKGIEQTETVQFVKDKNEQVVTNNTVQIITSNQNNTSNNNTTTQQPVQQIAGVVNSVNKTENNIATVVKNTENANNTVNTIHKQDEAVIAQPAVYRQLDTNEEENNNTVYVGNLKVNKTKLNNLFKKARGLFGKSKKEAASEETYTSKSNTL